MKGSGILKSTRLYVLICLIIITPGCNILNPNDKADGYYTKHFYSCGPQAIKDAITEYRGQSGIYVKRPETVEDISKQIQDTGNGWRFLASLFHEDGVDTTCPSEIREVCKQHGFTAVPMTKFSDLDPEKHIALILIRTNKFTRWHWICFPVHSDIDKWYGEQTAIQQIYLLSPIAAKHQNRY